MAIAAKFFDGDLNAIADFDVYFAAKASSPVSEIAFAE
jgi:hypothetical protein